MSDEFDSSIDSFMADLSLPTTFNEHLEDGEIDSVEPALVEAHINMVNNMALEAGEENIIHDQFLPQISSPTPTPEPPSAMFSFPSIDSQDIDFDDIGEPTRTSTPIPVITIQDSVEVVTIQDSDDDDDGSQMDDSVMIINSESDVSKVIKEIHAKINRAVDLVGMNMRVLRDFKHENNKNHSIEDEIIDILIDDIEDECDNL